MVPIVGLFLAMNFLGSSAKAAYSPLSTSGVFFYGDTTNAGIMRARTFTATATANAEFNGITGSASNILQTVAKTAVTREEIMIGSIRVNGELQIETCTTGCDANGDFTNRWANAGTSGTLDCDNTTPAADQCLRPFDLDYESLKGRAMVAYADNVADKFYYALWDGSAWSPDSSPDSPSATNEVDFHTGGTGGTPQWIRVIPAGKDLGTDRSDRIMVLISDTNDDFWACYWDGSSFSCLNATLEGSLRNCGIAQCFDGAWQDNGTFVAVYSDTAANTMRYQIYTVGSGWGGEQNGPALNSNGQWFSATSSPTSSRILVTSNESGDDARSIVWRGDNSTNGWTTCAITDCPDVTTETVTGQQAFSAFERFNGEGLYLYNDAANNTDTDYSTYTPSASWGAVTTAGITTTDDNLRVKAWGSPNSDDIMVMSGDLICDSDARLWTGGGWGTLIASIEVENSNYGVACPFASGTPGTDPSGAGQNFDFTWKIYTPWQRNWRFYSGSDTASTPTTALAAENTATTGVTNGQDLRLRINYAERGRSISNNDARKKLQYTTGCNPNSVLETTCTWTDVDDPAGAGLWRYLGDADIACTATDCDDGTTLVGTVLTGSSTCSAGLGCGTWVGDKDAAAGANMDHTAQSGADTVQESEYIIEPNGATPGSTYYFRIYDVDQVTPIYREQDANDCGGGAAQCTYPSLTMANVDQLRYRWRSDDGNETTGTSLVAENTAFTSLAKSTNYRLRFQINVGGGFNATSYNYRLEYAARVGGVCDTDESYTTVPDTPTTEHFDMVLTSNYADGASSTDAGSGPGVLSNPSGSFTAGKLVESTSNSTGALTVNDANYTEIEYAIQANSNATDGQNYCFRVTNAGTALISYSAYAAAQLVIVGPTTDQILRNGSWFSGGVEQSFFWSN